MVTRAELVRKVTEEILRRLGDGTPRPCAAPRPAPPEDPALADAVVREVRDRLARSNAPR